MKLAELHLKAFGPFTDLTLHLGTGKQSLVLVHGLNEAGKSSALRAISGLRFGIPVHTDDNFMHEYKKMRVGGVFVDSHEKRYPLMRRKGTGITLKFADFSQGGVELADPVPADLHRLLTGGLSVDDYQSMFGLDHDTLRKGGRALVNGEGEIGAALFEASSGVENVSKILRELDTTAKTFFLPAAHAKHGHINQALSEYRAHAEQYKEAQVKPAKWEAISRASTDASANLQAFLRERNQHVTQQMLIKELIAVAPILSALEHANKMLADLKPVPLLTENAATERTTAEVGLSEALADILINKATIREQCELIENIDLDPSIVAIAQSVNRLHAAANTITQLRTEITTAESDILSCTQTLNSIAKKIDPTLQTNDVVQRAPTATGKTQINERIYALEEARRALTQHRLNVTSHNTLTNLEVGGIPEMDLQATVRVTLAEIGKKDATLLRLSKLPNEIREAERKVETALTAVDLPNEQAARRVRPLLGAAIDDASQRLTALASKRIEKVERVEKMQIALAKQQVSIEEVLAHGNVPTRDDVRDARLHRQEGWVLVKATYIEGKNPDVESFALGKPLSEAYENAVSEADGLIDVLATETVRATNLEVARRELVTLERDLTLQRSEIQSIDTEQEAFNMTWQQNLALACIPIMPPAELRDWQDLLGVALTSIEALRGKRDELQQAQDIEKRLADKLAHAITKLGITKINQDNSLDTLVVIAQEDMRQVEIRIAARNEAVGQALQLQKQATLYSATEAGLLITVETARNSFSSQVASLMLNEEATIAMAKSRLAEFDDLIAVNVSVVEATSRYASRSRSLSFYEEMGQSISTAMQEHPNRDFILAAEIWSARLEKAQAQQTRTTLAAQKLADAKEALSLNETKTGRHRATLARLCANAHVETVAELPEAEEQSKLKYQTMRDANAAIAQLSKASRHSVTELIELLDGREHAALSNEESLIEQKLKQSEEQLEKARIAEEVARHALDDINSSDIASAAADAMARAAATVRNTLPLQMRTRLAHSLLQEAVRRFKERSQAPMLKSASRYYAQITGGEFEGLINDDSGDVPVIAAKRSDGEILSVEALSEGTRDQLYLALRLAALKLQRDRGVNLPVILDDVLMASDDIRAGCIFKALADFSESGQVIVFTHHHHLCDVARKNVGHETMALVEIKRPGLQQNTM